jgi:poly(A) polymerase
LPEVGADGCKRLERLVAAERTAGMSGDPARRLSALLPPDSLVAEKVAARLKLSNRLRKRLALAAVGDLDGSPQSLAYGVGKEGAEDRLLLAGQTDAAREVVAFAVPRLPIGGGELIRRGLPPGPIVATTLKRIERRWVEEGFPDEERLAQLVDEALGSAR